MNQYNSYYLYQQYEKRGSQDWLPCYPNIFSVDGDGTMPLVMKKENDPDCGYTGDTEPIYRWYPLPITTDYICDECPIVQYRWENMNPSTDYYCEGTTKYYKQIRQYSYDSGTTWYDVVPPEYQQGGVYEQQSTDCGYVPPIEPQYRTTSGTPYCEGVDKYVEVYSQVSYDGGITWSTTATTPTLVEHNSVECGYIEPQYRTTSGTPYCTGYDKYVDILDQVSYDGGSTWETTATTTTLVEAQSYDCGYIPPYYDKYFTIIAKSDGKLNKGGLTGSTNYQYSRDEGNTWKTGYGITNISVSTGDRIMFKGNLPPTNYNGIGTFSASTAQFEVEGNPMSLLFGDNFIGITSLSGKDCAFMRLFSRCTTLTSIENLVLPATTLSTLCYCQMFNGCTSLTSIPIGLLPATTLAGSCYYGMFQSCTSLTTVPVDLLPATTLASSCYEFMFNGCGSLTSAPDLPATTLPQSSYQCMFQHCANLSYVKCLATDISATDCTSGWLYGVSSSGTFVKNSSMSGWSVGTSGIPNNWIVQNAS